MFDLFKVDSQFIITACMVFEEPSNNLINFFNTDHALNFYYYSFIVIPISSSCPLVSYITVMPTMCVGATTSVTVVGMALYSNTLANSLLHYIFIRCESNNYLCYF